MDYKKRIYRLRKKLEANKLDGIIVPLDASMEYFTGIPRISQGNTKQRQISSEYGCLIITLDKISIFMSDLNLLVTKTKLNGKDMDVEFYEYCNGDLTGNKLKEFIRVNKLENKRLGVMSDVPSSITIRLINNHNVRVENADHIVYSMRAIKDEEEIKLLNQVSNITDKIFNDLLSVIKVGEHVEDIELYIEKLILKHGASQNSFKCELNCFGPKAGNMVGNGYTKIEHGYVLGLDMGVYYKGFCSDFGRTIFIGEPTKEHREIYEIINNSYNQAISTFDNGTCEDADIESRKVIEDAGYGANYIHKLGHGIGMDVHEYPLLTYGNKTKFREGMVFAVEPSIFIPHNCFIRIENMVLVTCNGPKQLSNISNDIFTIN